MALQLQRQAPFSSISSNSSSLFSRGFKFLVPKTRKFHLNKDAPILVVLFSVLFLILCWILADSTEELNPLFDYKHVQPRDAISNFEQRSKEPILYIKMQLAILKLEQGDQKECKNLLEDGKSTLDSMTVIDPSVYASYYWVSSQYHKYRQEFVEFYRSALLYLAYTSVESLSD